MTTCPWKSLALKLCELEIAIGAAEYDAEHGKPGAADALDVARERYCAALDELRAAARRRLMEVSWAQEAPWKDDDVAAPMMGAATR